MNPGQVDLLTQFAALLAPAVKTGALVGLGAGLLAGLVVFGVQRARGWLGEAAIGRALAACWLLGLSAVLGLGVGSAASVIVAAAPTLAASPAGQGVLRDLGGQGADVIAGTVALAASRGLVTLPEDAPEVPALLEGFRGGWELPVASVHDTARALGPALRAPDGEALGRDLVAALPLTVEPTWRSSVAGGVAAAVARTREGLDPSDVDATVPEAWSRLEEAAALGGDPGALGRLELAELLAERVIVPVIARLVQGPALLAAGGLLGLLVLGWAAPPVLVLLARALTRRGTASEST